MPALGSWMASPFVRGAVTGVGVITAFAGLRDLTGFDLALARDARARRDRRAGSRRTVIARPRPCVYLVTARALVAPDARTLAGQLHFLGRWLDDAVTAGVDVIQVRERDLAAGRPDAVRLGSCRAHAGDVHPGARERPVGRRGGRSRRRRASPVVRPARVPRAHPAPPPFLVGRSIHTAAEALTHRGADYLIFGTVFAGGLKTGSTPP